MDGLAALSGMEPYGELVAAAPRLGQPGHGLRLHVSAPSLEQNSCPKESFAQAGQFDGSPEQLPTGTAEVDAIGVVGMAGFVSTTQAMLPEACVRSARRRIGTAA